MSNPIKASTRVAPLNDLWHWKAVTSLSLFLNDNLIGVVDIIHGKSLRKCLSVNILVKL